MNLVNPLKDFGNELNKVQCPSRYLCCDYGATIKSHEEGKSYFNYAVAFPDLYEIGMSNLAVKIIYNGINQYESLRCERVFAPAPDFEALLKEKKIPLYTLETGIPLCDYDMIGFSIGYELGITEVLAMLELGGVPLTCEERKEGDPIVLAGGCGVTNPAPIGKFFDAVFIGEAEDELFKLCDELSVMKKNGKSRQEMMDYVSSKSFIWTSNQQNKISMKHVQNNFGLVPSVPSWFPLPTQKPVQDHGVIEIMRGCPNGCRFCHAGIYYRPTRVKNLNLIINEIDHLVFDAGYREISLNSLSSADFPEVEQLLDILNERYKGYNVSFQLPSLKVNSMSLGILEKLNQVRKSGLTFAVETPEEMWQLSLNKEVYAQHLETIIKEAKARGWSSAKFYFMFGLPFGDENLSEEKAIVDFLLDLQAKTRIQCNVNVGVFIPKPHTPYQWVKQLTNEEAQKKYDYLYENLPRGKFKLGRHNLNGTVLEGLLSRGDERVGDIILKTYKKGARFDSWDDHLRENIKLWNESFAEADWNVMEYIYKDWSLDEKLPWDDVSLGVGKVFYKKEWEKHLSHQLTKRCMSDCDHKCGVCNTKNNVEVYHQEKVQKVSETVKANPLTHPQERPECNIPVMYRVVFKFNRNLGCEYTAYLSQVEIFHKAFLRNNLEAVFTAGFNPLPRLEFVSAMTLGIPSVDEIATCYLFDKIDEEVFISEMNKSLPEGFKVTQAFIFPVTNMRKREALSQGLWGALYQYNFFNKDECKSFISSKEFNDYLETNPLVKVNSSYSDNKILTENDFSNIENEFFLQVPVSDKKFRLVLEEYFGKKWFEVVEILKLKTFAKMVISGWTAKDEDNWRHNSKEFVKDETNENDEKTPVSFFELYEKIAQINKDLIEKRAELTSEQDSFYKEHPDVKEKHNIQ